MAARFLLSRDATCMLCGAVTARLVRPSGDASAQPRLVLAPHVPRPVRLVRGRLVCAFCGGSLILDGAEDEFVETQRVYPRDRRGRPPGRAPRDPADEALA